MLAFTNDVQHWRKKDQLVGVSVRSIIVNVFVQVSLQFQVYSRGRSSRIHICS